MRNIIRFTAGKLPGNKKKKLFQQSKDKDVNKNRSFKRTLNAYGKVPQIVYL